MDGQVLQLVRLRIGDIWLDVPVGPCATSTNQRMDNMTASPTEHDQGMEVFSPLKFGGSMRVDNKEKGRQWTNFTMSNL